MLFGIDVPRLLEPFEVIRGEDENDSFSVRTRNGWISFLDSKRLNTCTKRRTVVFPLIWRIET